MAVVTIGRRLQSAPAFFGPDFVTNFTKSVPAADFCNSAPVSFLFRF
jgi:hypothetical protein